MSKRPLLFVIALAAGLSTAAIDASAREFSRQGSVTGANGNTWSRSINRSVDPTTGSASRSVTGPGGRTRSANSQWNSATHGFDTTVTGPNGNTASRSASTSVGQGSVSRNVTGFGGRSRSVNVTTQP